MSRFVQLMQETLEGFSKMRISRGTVAGAWFDTDGAFIDGDTLVIADGTFVRLDTIETFSRQ